MSTIWRNSEIRLLTNLIAIRKSREFITLYGRRRMGKVCLIDVFHGGFGFREADVPRVRRPHAAGRLPRCNRLLWQQSQTRLHQLIRDLRRPRAFCRQTTCDVTQFQAGRSCTSTRCVKWIPNGPRLKRSPQDPARQRQLVNAEMKRNDMR